MNKTASLILCIITSLIVLNLPTDAAWFPLQGITVVEQRVLALFFFAAMMWVLEPIPVYATSVLIIMLELLMVSDKSLVIFQGSADDPSFGTVLTYQSIFGTFSSPIILLFLGGFFLAMATTKYRLDLNLARVLLAPFGNKPSIILLGLMIITALFSMFMSNTASTAMMFAILTPVLGAFDQNDRGRNAFILAIPFAANVGGLGTPIGTPPNAIALKYLTGDNSISFGTWMAFGVPFVIVMLSIVWALLLFMFPPQAKKIDINIESKFLTNWRAIVLYVTFASTVVLWLLGGIHGMNSYVVAMIPVAVFSVTQVITKDDLKRISWDVLWLVSGGIALGLAMEKSGLSQSLINSIPFESMSPFLIILIATSVTLTMATFMSHTATANLLMPIVAALGTSLSSLEPLGGGVMLIIGVAFSASLAMSLPISTPPNAIAYASGLLESKNMLKAGIIIGIIGLLLDYVLLAVLNMVGFF